MKNEKKTRNTKPVGHFCDEILEFRAKKQQALLLS